MSFTKITNAEMQTHGVRGLADTPNLSAYEMQKKFDELSTDVLRPAHDRLVEELEDASAAGSIGAIVPDGMVALPNVQSVINSMATSNHTHANKEILDKFAEDSEGHLLFDDESIASKSFAKIKIGDVDITAGIDDVLTFLEGENVGLVANPVDNSITVSMTHDAEKVYVRYSKYADGTDFVEYPTSETPYMGLAVLFSDTAPTDKEDYSWILIGLESQNPPQFSINWETGDMEYTGSTYIFTADEDGFLHWGIV